MKKEKETERKSKGRLLKAVQHLKHEFKAAVSQQVNHHIEYIAVCHTLILVIKYISHYNHLVTNLTHLYILFKLYIIRPIIAKKVAQSKCSKLTVY